MAKSGSNRNGTTVRWVAGIVVSAMSLYATSAVSFARGQATQLGDLGNRVTAVEVRQEGFGERLDKIDRKLNILLARKR